MPPASHAVRMTHAFSLTLAVIAAVALAGRGETATLELSFDQGSFTANTSGTFRLTGNIPATGYGSGGYYIGDEFINEYYSFSCDYTLAFDTPPPAAFTFFLLQATTATGTAVRDTVTYSIDPARGIGFNMFGGEGGVGQVQVYLENTPNPNFSVENLLPNNTYGTFLVDISGNFAVNAMANGGDPASAGVSFGNVAGTHASVLGDEPLTVSVAVAVPEPGTCGLACLAAASLLLRCRMTRRK